MLPERFPQLLSHISARVRRSKAWFTMSERQSADMPPPNSQNELLRKAVVSLEKKLRESTERVATLQEQVAQRQQEVAELPAVRGRLAEALATRDALDQQVEQWQRTAAQARGEVEDARRQLERTQAAVQAAEAAQQRVAEQAAQLRTGGEALQLEEARARGQAEMLAQQVQQLEAANGSLRLDNQAHAGKLKAAYERYVWGRWLRGWLRRWGEAGWVLLSCRFLPPPATYAHLRHLHIAVHVQGGGAAGRGGGAAGAAAAGAGKAAGRRLLRRLRCGSHGGGNGQQQQQRKRAIQRLSGGSCIRPLQPGADAPWAVPCGGSRADKRVHRSGGAGKCGSMPLPFWAAAGSPAPSGQPSHAPVHATCACVQADRKAGELEQRLAAMCGAVERLRRQQGELRADLGEVQARCGREAEMARELLATNLLLHETVAALMERGTSPTAAHAAGAAGSSEGSAQPKPPLAPKPQRCSQPREQRPPRTGLAAAADRQQPAAALAARRSAGTARQTARGQAAEPGLPSQEQRLPAAAAGRAAAAWSQAADRQAEPTPHMAHPASRPPCTQPAPRRQPVARQAAVKAALSLSGEHRELLVYQKALAAELQQVASSLAVAETGKQLALLRHHAQVQGELRGVAAQLEDRVLRLTALRQAGLV